MAWQRSPRGIVSNDDMTAVTYQSVSGGKSKSRSTFYELPKDDWDSMN